VPPAASISAPNSRSVIESVHQHEDEPAPLVGRLLEPLHHHRHVAPLGVVVDHRDEIGHGVDTDEAVVGVCRQVVAERGEHVLVLAAVAQLRDRRRLVFVPVARDRAELEILRREVPNSIPSIAASTIRRPSCIPSRG